MGLGIPQQIRQEHSLGLRADVDGSRVAMVLRLVRFGPIAAAPARGVSPVFPKVYYVTGRGVRKLRESLAAQGKPWRTARVDRGGRSIQEGHAAEHIIHEILITEFLLALWQTVHGRADLELLTIQRRSLAKHPAHRVAINGRNTRLIPNAMFLFRRTGGGMVCCLVELDNGTMNKKKIRAKYAGYLAWSQSAAGKQYLIDLYRRHGAAEPRPTFRLLVIARSRTGKDDQQRMLELCRPLAKLSAAMQDRFWFTTVAALRSCQDDLLPLDVAIWPGGETLTLSEKCSSRAAPGARRRLFRGQTVPQFNFTSCFRSTHPSLHQ